MKSALVTGSSGLIGRAIVDSFLASNYRVFGLDLVDREEFENQNFHFLKVDLADLGNIHQVVMDVSLKIDSLDCLVNNASCRPDGFFEPSHKYNLQTFEDVLKINLTSNLALSSELFNLMTKSESPSIINMSSIYGLRAPRFSIYPKDSMGEFAFTTPVSYSVAKAAIVGLTKHLAMEWGSHGIRVNAIAPGGIENSQDPDFVRKYKDQTSLGRMCKIKDVVNMVNFLSSEESNYLTGLTIPVDGGWTL